jgi:two-component system, OmpR family, sensor histidine kinase VicK
VLYGIDNVITGEIQFFSNPEIKKIDTCMNHTRPPLAITIEPIRSAFIDAKKRGVKIRYLTEITNDNIPYCKKLIELVDELRHLDRIKGNFMVSDQEYLAPVVLFEKEKIASQIVYNDVKQLVDQHQYMFDTLWSKAISARQRIREIEEDIISYETKVLEEHEEKIKKFKGYLENSNQLSVCTLANRIQLVYNNFFDIVGKILDRSKNGGHKGIRWLTSITDKDSVNLVKVFLDTGVVIRHINQIPMSFGVSDKEVVGSIANTEGSEMAKTLFSSNDPLYVKHFSYLFEDLWKNGIDARERIKEIEKGGPHIRTRLLEEQDEIIREINHMNNSADKLSICSGFGGMQMSYRYFFDSYKNIVDKYGKEVEKKFDGLRWIINVDKDSIQLVKIFLESGFQIRHIKNMLPINFGVSDKELALRIEKMEGGVDVNQSFLISNEPLYVNHFNSVFEDLWKNGIDAAERIKDIEEGVDLADIEAIRSSARAQDLYLDIIRSAKEEILWIFPTFNAFIRQEKIGAIPLAKEKNVKVRILVPFHKSIEDTIQKLKAEHSTDDGGIDIRYIEQMSKTKATILVVDRRVSLVMELKDDTKSTFHGAIGLSTYSNSKAGVLSYVAIFENLWRQAELYHQVRNSNDRLAAANEQLKIHSRMQREFIDIAAHELRTPIQPILGLTQVISSRVKDREEAELLKVVSRNARRLQQLTEDLLDVTRIESNSLVLNKEQFDINEVIATTINDIHANVGSLSIKNKENIRILYEPPKNKNKNIMVEADKARISQVISNLLNNAVKFIPEEEGGSIAVVLEESKNDVNKEEVIVKIKDSGLGIASEIMPRLFTKFATKSEKGTGLGLFISKSIIEAHGGRIWAENNKDSNEKGATFTFSLPVSKQQQPPPPQPLPPE